MNAIRPDVLGLRDVYLTAEPGEFEPLAEAQAAVHGVGAELRVPGGYVLVAAVADGTSRLMFGFGAGLIGGAVPHDERTAELARASVRLARSSIQHFALASDRTVPTEGRTRITVLTQTGRLSAEAETDALDRSNHPLFELFSTLVSLQLALQDRIDELGRLPTGEQR